MSYTTGRSAWTIEDYDHERSVFEVNHTPLSASNFNAQGTLRSNLENALVTIQGGRIIRLQTGNVTLAEFGGPPTHEHQRELKWLISYHGTTNLRRYSVTIPCALTGLLNPNNRPYALLTGMEWAAFVAAFQAFVKTPRGDGVKIDAIQLVGRHV